MNTLAERGTDKEAVRQELIRLREASGLSQRAVGDALKEHGGDAISGQAVGEWERGNNLPSRRNAFALERLYGVDEGALASRMGYHPATEPMADVHARLDAIEATVKRIETMLAEGKVSRRR